MIKINLLAEGKRPTAVRRASRDTGSFLEGENVALVMLLLTFLFPVLIAGGVYYKYHRDLEAKQAEVAAAEEEVRKLQSVLREVEEFKAKKAELERKIQVINDLRDNQRGPVQVMDAISRALPELLWLDRMQMGPNQITLSGRAFNFNAIANLAEALDAVPAFNEPHLRDSSEQGQVYNFVMAFNYSYTRSRSEQAAPSTEAAGDTGLTGPSGAEAPASLAPASGG